MEGTNLPPMGAGSMVLSSGSRILDAKWDGRSTFTLVEAGVDILGMSRWSAYEAAKKGYIPTVKVGHRLIVPRHALERLLGAV